MSVLSTKLKWRIIGMWVKGSPKDDKDRN
ncbi:hypothetical protein LCGC14_3030130, partial [marine sediment metagenome]